jgi:hypothetical protein
MVAGLADYFRQYKRNTRIMPYGLITELSNINES